MTSDLDLFMEPDLESEEEIGEDEVFLFPASFAQRRLWFLDELNQGNCLYNIPSPVRLKGQLNQAALEDALAEIVYRQESLRTTFTTVEGEVMQVIDPAMIVPLEQIDLRDTPQAKREARALELATEEARRPFDLAQGPLMRTTLLQLGEEDHVLLLTMHHIISDGWSMGVLVQELTLLYSAFAQNEDSPLSDLPLQYADFSHWQREYLQGAAMTEQLAYWEGQLGDVSVLQLPTSRPRPAMQANRGALYPFALPQALTKSLHDLTQQAGATLYMTLLAAFQTLLHRYSGQTDIAVGTPIAGRNEAEIEGLIGFFVNTLVLRSDLTEDPTFRDLLKQVRETTLDAYAHQDVPFEKIVEKIQPERNMSHTPLFQVMFAMQNTPVPEVQLPGLTLSPVRVDLEMAKFDLTLTLAESTDGLQGALEYNTDLFDRATIERMIGHFENLLRAIIHSPDQRLSQLPLLTEGERKQLLEEWSNPSALTAEPTDSMAKSLHQVFEKEALRRPNAVAVTYEDQKLTYRDLNERANRLAHHLHKMGVGTESLVGICMERSLELVVSILAVLKAGGAYVPLDPAYPQDRIAFVLEDASVTVLLTQASFMTSLPEHNAQVVYVDRDWDTIAQEPADNPNSGVTPDNLAYVIYTSGSTGKPKGVQIPHRNVIRLFTATDEWYGFNEQDVWTLFHSFAFDFSVWEIWGALLYGGRLVVVPYLTSRSPDTFYDLLQQEQVTVLNQTPSAFRQLMYAEELTGVSENLALRYVIFGGEALELRSLKSWFERHGDHKPQLVNMYGITETTVHVTYRPLTVRDAEEAAGSMIGVPIPDLQVYVLDRHLQPEPVGVVGEMYVGGEGVARGYLNRLDLTDERFIAHPFSKQPGARLYKTGDLARFLPNGDLEYHGRIDDQVKIRGFRIEPGEIESALSQHDQVRAAVVIVREDKPGDKRLVAYIMSDKAAGTESKLTASDLRQFIAQDLPEHMIPAAFVLLDTLPLTQNGKVDTRALPAPDPTQQERTREYVAPRNEAEQALVDIYQEVLGLEQVGIDDKYFELGGDSILSIQVLARARKRGLHFSLQDLFRHQTVRDLVPLMQAAAGEMSEVRSEPYSLLTDTDRDRLPAGEDADVEDAYPLTQLQAGMLFHTQLHPESAVYHNVNTYRLRGPFDQQAFEQAAVQLAEKHAVLRSSFHLIGYSEPLQLVLRDARIPVEVHDLRHLSETEQEQAIAVFMEEEKHRHFDYAKAPLLRFFVHLRTEDTFQFGFTEHHVILDGWSVATMLSEFFHTYLSLRKNGTQTGETTLPFREFVALERAALASEETKRYWNDKLSGHTFLKLPRSATTHATAAATTKKSETDNADMRAHLVDISQELSHALKRTAEMVDVPLKSVFLAAHLRVMSLASGQADVLTGLVSNGRVEAEGGEKTLGLFLNTLPYRLELTGGTWADLVRETFSGEQEFMPHRRYPMAQIQLDLGGTPLFETTFNYTHFHVYKNVFGTDEIEILEEDGFGITNFTYGVDFSVNSATSDVLLKVWWDGGQFSDAHMERIAGCYVRVLEAMAHDPQARYEAQSFLSPEESHRLLIEWNQTAKEYPDQSALHSLFEEQVERTPDAIAVSFQGEQLTYRELNGKANQLAQRLQKEGVATDIPVGLCLDRSLEMIIGLLGILKAGGAYVPIDPSYPSDRIAYILSDTQVPVLLTQKHLLADLSVHVARTLCLDADWASVATENDANLDTAVQPEDLAYLIYTSGSTGQPKGVMIPHRAICNHMFWMQETYPLTAQDRVLQKTPFGFDASVWEFWAPLLAGAQLVMAKPGGHQDSRYLASVIHEKQITVLQLVPTLLHMLLDEPNFAACTSLRHVFCGGEVLSPELEQRFLSQMSAELHNLYGPTEACIDTTAWDCRLDTPHRTVPIGRPIANAQVYILDANLQLVPAGVPGELHIGGRGLARGYWQRPDLTEEKFIHNPFGSVPKDRLYKTGDIARYLPDGAIEYLDRADNQVKIRGFRIELGEIECLLAAKPNVKEVLVIAREINDDKRIVAYLTASDSEHAPTANELREALRAQLPDYMLPSAFVVLEAFPLTQNGKVDRKALPAPQEVRPDTAGRFLPPRDTLELAVAQLFEDVLNVYPVGVRDTFFDLGGHSLLAVRLMAKIRQQFDRDLPLSALFQGGTVETLAALLRQQGHENAHSSLVEIQKGDGLRPFFIVHPVGGNVLVYHELARELGPEQPFYGLQAKGLEDGSAPLNSVETMAAHYLDEIRTVQPEGPYHLGGWSFGGTVALEMASQLKQKGEDVALLALFDSTAPIAAFKDERFARESFILQAFLDSAAASFGFDLTHLLEQVEFLKTEDVLFELLEQAKQQNVLPPGAGLTQIERLYRILHANMQAEHRYIAAPSDQPMLLLRAKDQTSRCHDDPTTGWSEVARGDLTVLEVPGDHTSMLQTPHVQVLAEQLKQHLHTAHHQIEQTQVLSIRW